MPSTCCVLTWLTADYNDDTLKAHQDEINKLQLKLKEYKPIILLIERRETIKRERAELESAAHDKTRLLSKSSGAGHLLREEKVRRMVTKEMPKIDEKLKVTLTQWESMYGQPFLYHGEHYLQVMDNEIYDEQQKKAKEKEQRELARNRRAGLVPTMRETAPPAKPATIKPKTPVAPRRAPLTPSNRMAPSPMTYRHGDE